MCGTYSGVCSLEKKSSDLWRLSHIKILSGPIIVRFITIGMSAIHVGSAYPIQGRHLCSVVVDHKSIMVTMGQKPQRILIGLLSAGVYPACCVNEALPLSWGPMRPMGHQKIWAGATVTGLLGFPDGPIF